MTVISVSITEDGGSTSILVMNTREDLRDDFRFFIDQARAYDADAPETMFLHQRFLRAALFAVFAYAEAVVNGWLQALLESRQEGSRFKRLERKSLEEKITWLHNAVTATAAEPNVKDAKLVRNLFIHFKPRCDAEAFKNLSLALVEGAICDLERWMTEMETTLSLPRHDDSDKVAHAFGQVGPIGKEVSSSQSRSAIRSGSQPDCITVQGRPEE